jgi:hypothetical protein
MSKKLCLLSVKFFQHVLFQRGNKKCDEKLKAQMCEIILGRGSAVLKRLRWEGVRGIWKVEERCTVVH